MHLLGFDSAEVFENKTAAAPGLERSAGELGSPDYKSGGREFKSLRARQYNQRLTSIDDVEYPPLGAQLGAHNEGLAPATA